eukprot:gene16966-22538_t
MGDLALQWYWRGAADKDGVAKEVLAMPPGGFLIRSSTSTLDAYVLTVNDHGIILNLQILPDAKGNYYMKGSTSREKHATVVALVTAFGPGSKRPLVSKQGNADSGQPLLLLLANDAAPGAAGGEQQPAPAGYSTLAPDVP